MRRRGTTIVFSTHDMNAAERMCERIFMIFKGNKVLDGTLDEIQTEYGHDTARVRVTGGAAMLHGLPSVEAVNDHGNFQDVRLNGDAQHFLQQLVQKTTVQQFELRRPSLHDVFVRIARPTADDLREDLRANEGGAR
jgi:ABC-2 type transport system ATP-binding protein